MLKAGSLLYSIFIVLIISAIGSSFIMFNYYHKLRLEQYQGRIQALNRVESAMNLLKVKEVNEAPQGALQLFENDIELTNIKLKPWGGYYIASVKSRFRQATFQQAALLGYLVLSPFALYLADNSQPLSISGGTRINGKSFLPKRGVKRAYIEGQSYTGISLINGQEQQSTDRLPAVNSELLSYLKGMLQTGIPEEIEEIAGLSKDDYTSTNRSFFNRTLCYYSSEKLLIGADSISGNVIVKSDKEIIVSKQSVLENIILVAPKISLQPGFEGSVHLIASDSIKIGVSSRLNYPSSVLLNSGKTETAIIFEEDCEVQGEVLLHGKKENANSGLIKIKENSKIMGHVYCFDQIELKGEVAGSVSCNKFLLKTSSSIYENHILNGKINAVNLPKNYLGAKWEGTSEIREVVKWLK